MHNHKKLSLFSSVHPSTCAIYKSNTNQSSIGDMKTVYSILERAVLISWEAITTKHAVTFREQGTGNLKGKGIIYYYYYYCYYY
jgi:hypothetical protein